MKMDNDFIDFDLESYFDFSTIDLDYYRNLDLLVSIGCPGKEKLAKYPGKFIPLVNFFVSVIFDPNHLLVSVIKDKRKIVVDLPTDEYVDLISLLRISKSDMIDIPDKIIKIFPEGSSSKISIRKESELLLIDLKEKKFNFK